jgi:Xaa-Pro aminopeptidase
MSGDRRAMAREQSGGGRPVLIGGAFMPQALHRELTEGVGTIADKTADLRALMRRKSARELGAIQDACAALDAAVAGMNEAQRSGAGATAAVLAGEHAAHRSGAQDVRTLFSLDGGRTLRPFETPVERAVDPLQIYVAVRRFGYWAEGFAVVTASTNPSVEGADEVLQYAVEMIKPGVNCGEIGRSITEAIQPFHPHPITQQVQGNAIGLALEEHPLIADGSEDVFEAGGVYSLRVGLADERAHAIVSAMIAVNEYGCKVLWSSPLPEKQ